MGRLQQSDLLPKVRLPLEVEVSGLGFLTADYPSSSPVLILDDWVQFFQVPPHFLVFPIGSNLLPCLWKASLIIDVISSTNRSMSSVVLM